MTVHRTSDSGFSLIEMLIAMVVLSVGVLAVLGALRVGINSGRMQRELSTAELTLRSYAEHITAQSYVACAGVNVYGAGFNGSDLLGGARLPPDRLLRPGDPSSEVVSYTASVDAVYYLQDGALDDGRLSVIVDDAGAAGDFVNDCDDPDQGLQLIRIQVRLDSSASGEAVGSVLETSIVKASD